MALQEMLAAKGRAVGKECDLHSWGNPLVMAPQAKTTHFYPSPTSLRAVCTPQEAIRGAGDQADPCGRGERAHPEPSSQLPAGGSESLHLQLNTSDLTFISTRGARGSVIQSPTAP